MSWLPSRGGSGGCFGHLTHSQKAVYPHLVGSMQLGGSVLHRRQWARVTCQRKMPSCFRLALRMDRVPTMQQCKKACCKSAGKRKKENQEGKKVVHAMLPALALSRMRLQVPPGWSLKSLGRGSCLALPTSIGVPLGFPRGGQHGGTPASRSSTRRASLGSPQRGVLQKMPCDGLRGWGCASLSPYSQRDAQMRLPWGHRARPPLLPLVPSCCNIWGGCGAGDTSAKQRHRPLLLHRSGVGGECWKTTCWDAASPALC